MYRVVLVALLVGLSCTGAEHSISENSDAGVELADFDTSADDVADGSLNSDAPPADVVVMDSDSDVETSLDTTAATEIDSDLGEDAQLDQQSEDAHPPDVDRTHDHTEDTIADPDTELGLDQPIDTSGDIIEADEPDVSGLGSCESPIDLGAGSFSFDTTDSPSEHGNYAGTCTSDTSLAAAGPELLFSVEVPPHTVLDVTVSPSGWDAVVAIVIDCFDSSSGCANYGDGPDLARFENNNEFDAAVFVIVDGFSEIEFGEFDLEVSLTDAD